MPAAAPPTVPTPVALWQAGILRRASDGFQQVRTIDGASKRVFVIGAAIFDGGGHEG